MRRLLTIAAVLALGGGLATPASAATVRAGDFAGELELTAAQGEANEVRLFATRVGGAVRVRVVDRGAPLEAGDGCEEEPGSDEVTCDIPGLYIVFVKLRDRDDSLDAGGMLRSDQVTGAFGEGDDTVDGPPGDACLSGGRGDDDLELRGPTRGCLVRGGAGADLLRGSGGRDNLLGDEGRDKVRGLGGPDGVDGGGGPDDVGGGGGRDSSSGGSGADLVAGGNGDDFLSDDPGDDRLRGSGGDDVISVSRFFGGGDDRLTGGDGHDLASYFCGSCEISLDGVANDGRVRRGERDNVDTEDVEVISHFFDDDEGELFTYGSGRDRIAGDGHDNVIRADRGADRIDGRGGTDHLFAGKGPDAVRASDGERDDVDCGRGDDEAIVDPIDQLSGCELVGIPR